MRRTMVAGALLMTCAAALPAQQPLVITALNLTARSRGSQSQAVLPGDVLQYQLRFTNQSQGDVSGVVFTNPVPTGLRYVDGSAGADRQDVAVEYSTDGGNTYAATPLVTEVVAGQRVQRPAPPEQYTHVRWLVRGSIAPGASVTAEFRATLPAAQPVPDSSSHQN
ncbi:MAG TPA: hypothetical protein VFO67_19755 [Gemmatimonadales bacterium]|nr:hypothetical protein [Gemmatimonadales bacterium]